MNIKKINSLAGMAAMLFTASATASTVSVNPDIINVVEGTSFNATVVADFIDVGGISQGGYTLSWDPSILTLNQAASGASTDISTIANFNEFFNFVDVTAGTLTYSFSLCPVFGAIPCDFVGDVSTFNLYDLVFDANNPGTSPVDAGLSLIGDVWLDPNEVVVADPIYSGASVTVSAVPVPAAVWLFGSGLIGLVGIARRKTQLA